MLRAVEVLIVDDNPSDIAMLRASFQECSMQLRFSTANDAGQAFELLEDPRRPAPTLIVLDVNLPGTDGFEVLRRIRADARWNAVPVVIMSSSMLRAEVDRAYHLHANAFIGKPSNLEAYFEIVRGLCTLWLEPLAAGVSRASTTA